MHNRSARPSQRVFWLCFAYLIGSLSFLSAATAALVATIAAAAGRGPTPRAVSRWSVDFAYLVGSLAFLVGAWIALRMWKVPLGATSARSRRDLERHLARTGRASACPTARG